MTEEPVPTTPHPEPPVHRCCHCEGRGYTFQLARVCTHGAGIDCRWVKVDCRTCGGSGEIGQEAYERIERGRAMHQARIDRLESLRDAAQRLGISPEALSRIEWGLES